MEAIRRFMTYNEGLARSFNARIDRRFLRQSGMIDFDRRILPSLLKPGLRTLDVGGGKQPLIPPDVRQKFSLHVTGLDLSAEELAAAPAGSYDATIVGDVGSVPLAGPYDLIVSRTVLEHVPKTATAIRNLAGALAPDGVMAHFLPCSNAPFALLNRMLGPQISSRLLWTVFPQNRRVAGFPAYYDECTPSRFRRSCESAGLEVVELNPYFYSDYGRFFLPIHVADTARQLLMMRLRADDLAESFTIVARKPAAFGQAAA